MSETKSTRTMTKTSTVNGKTVTKKITEVTITRADGSSETERTEEIIDGSDGGTRDFEKDFKDRFDKLDFNEDRKALGKKGPSESASKQTKETPDEFQEKCLKAHNSYRDKHGVPPLTLAGDLCKYAQNWAEHIASKNTLEHSNCKLSDEKLGENIFYQYPDNNSAQAACDSWYSEIKKYQFGREGHSSGTGHFTQMVWKSSKELGVGKATNGGNVYVVASYRPPGNFGREYAKNVFPPK